MDNYFQNIVNNLTLDDIEVLNVLSSKECTNKFTAKSKKEIMIKVNLSEANFRKSINRLDAILFIDISAGNREHLIFITEYGMQAIEFIYERNGRNVL